MEKEITTEIDGWSVTYPASCNGRIGDLGFVVRPNGFSDFVHFDRYGMPYGTYMPKKVKARIRAMRNRYLKKLFNTE